MQCVKEPVQYFGGEYDDSPTLSPWYEPARLLRRDLPDLTPEGPHTPLSIQTASPPV